VSAPPEPAAGDAARSLLLERALSQAVRTPLHSVLGFLELLSMTDLDDDQRRQLQQLADSSEELLSGTDRVLWLVRVLGGHYRPRPARVHLASFADEISAASHRSISPVVAPGTPPTVEADLAALHQLIAELVANAQTHGGAPVVLAVSPLAQRRDRVRITVSDGGRGLPAEARNALVAPLDALHPGGGVGLLLVRRLAAVLGGTLEVLPTSIGAHVSLTLPVTLAAVAAPEPSVLGATAPTRPLRVLLVEDNATNRLLTQRQLTRLGHSLTSVATGSEGVRAALAEDVDVVLMDRHLPDIDGCEAARQIIAALPEGRRLPIIAVTADATAEARESCAAAGMDEVLTKPVDLRHLGNALDRAAASLDQVAGGAPGTAVAGPGVPWVPVALRAVVARVDGDPHAAAELIATYLGELPGRRLRIQASLRRGAARSVVAAAESLRTSSDSIGATAVSGACAALGAAAADDDLAAAQSFLPSLMLQCERFSADLAGFTEPAGITAALDGGSLLGVSR
jgi:CheY-like chemotaxis protein/two-component sensor histidine kinase/HPt (histidine-containing phosphotransfer) domain-containing protein